MKLFNSTSEKFYLTILFSFSLLIAPYIALLPYWGAEIFLQFVNMVLLTALVITGSYIFSGIVAAILKPEKYKNFYKMTFIKFVLILLLVFAATYHLQANLDFFNSTEYFTLIKNIYPNINSCFPPVGFERLCPPPTYPQPQEYLLWIGSSVFIALSSYLIVSLIFSFYSGENKREKK